mmetsp:Transcript_16543/g.36573  ORF Transcript_16543/g.36573 Transcript_16543/m.36573 type:complete len:211 (-) Transcript_16543:575-1207(-)
MRSQGSGEHTSAPRPPGINGLLGLHEHATAPSLTLHKLDGLAHVGGLLLSRVGDLGDGLDLISEGLVAIPNGKDGSISPDLAVLGHHLQLLVDMDPLATSGALVGQALSARLLHEVVGSLNSDAHVRVVRLAIHADGPPERWVLRVVLHAVHTVDPNPLHVPVAIGSRGVRQGAQALVQEVDDGEPQVREEILQLSGPLYPNETSADHQY